MVNQLQCHFMKKLLLRFPQPRTFSDFQVGTICSFHDCNLSWSLWALLCVICHEACRLVHVPLVFVVWYMHVREISWYFPPNWLVFSSKSGSSGNITLRMPFILWLPRIQVLLPRQPINSLSWPNWPFLCQMWWEGTPALLRVLEIFMHHWNKTKPDAPWWSMRGAHLEYKYCGKFIHTKRKRHCVELLTKVSLFHSETCFP